MAIKSLQQNKKRGVAILIAVIFMSVILAMGLALSSLAYKQHVIASGAMQSHYAFYAADAALECILYADQKLNLFGEYNPSETKTIQCDDSISLATITQSDQPADHYKYTVRLYPNSGGNCADISVFKPKNSNGTNYIFSQGYDVQCAYLGTGARITSRGLSARY